MSAPDRRHRWDHIGVSLSGVCIVHCLLLPVLLATVPLWPALEQVHAWLHPVFAVLLVPTTLFAMQSGYRQHREKKVAGLLAGGLLVILAAGVLGHAGPGTLAETTLTLTGSGLLIAGHWRNWRACEHCRWAAQPGRAGRHARAAAVREEVACEADGGAAKGPSGHPTTTL